MSEIVLHQYDAKELKKINLVDELVQGPVRRGLLYYAVNSYLASQRSGTHSTKTRGQVAGSTKKIYRQKGTGRARHGSKKVPTFVGGGVAFGPSPRNYSFKLPKAARRRAIQSVFALRYKENALRIVENIDWEKPSTKKANNFFKSFNVKSAALIIDEENLNLRLSLSNLPSYALFTVSEINVYDLLKYDCLFVTEASLDKLYEKLHLVA
ncbi:MAG: 50S ribosomal protein L4 [Deltaproteobacteria bacterium]|nr:50S ribosomal protein L4 [Deltaproteobacteria bacterium]